jgi:hypothetical protein
MQQGVVEGSCFFRAENYNSMDRAAMDGARFVRGAGRVLQMWASLPSQLSQMSIDSTTGISAVVARGTGKVAVMISRYDLSNIDPIRLQLLLDQHGLSGNCIMTRYIEDVATTGNQGPLSSRSRITFDASSTPIEALVTLNNYSAALIVVEEDNNPVLSVSPASRSVDRTAGAASFTVNNSGTGTLTWTVQVIDGSSWLSISSGANGTNSGMINVAYTANSSWTTTRTGTIRITANGAGSPIDVTVVQAKGRLPGDANEDGAVDVGDLGILAANYGGTGKSWNQGDFNGDGAVDVGDLGILAANYGTNASSANWATDCAQAFGTTVDDESSEEEDTVGYSVCSALGLPLIAGLVLMGLMLVRLEE